MLTLRKLMENSTLKLRLVVGGDGEEASDSQLDHEFEWVHATDMIDPTPFLGPAEVILTLGWQFPVIRPADSSVPGTRANPAQLQKIYDDYVALVAAHGVIGIGFGSDVVHKGIPRELVSACMRHGLILFDVPYEISFMDLLQDTARVVQRNQSERNTRSLRAQKAIANAATRRDGLNATLRETARQLGCGVALYDSLGHSIIVVEAPDGPKVEEADLSPIVKKSLSEGLRFHSAQVTPEIEVIAQMLGEPDVPTGVLVLTLSQGFDDVSRNVLTSVLALVSVSLEQNQALGSLHTTLRQALLQLLLSGNIEMTRHILERVWGPLPVPPFVVLIGIPQLFDIGRIMPRLDSISPDSEFPVFYAQFGSELAILVQHERVNDITDRLIPFGLTFGWSICDRWDGLELALQEAHKAADFGMRRGRNELTAFSDIWKDGVADLIDASDASHVARRMFSALARHDIEHESQLLETLQVWLRHHGRLLPAARELGIHRHTLTNRMEAVSQLTGTNLDDYQDRTDLTLALRYYKP